MNTGRNPAIRLAAYLGVVIMAGFLVGLPGTAKAADVNPLAPVDTSSPRATLQGFIGTVDDIYVGLADILEEYAKSGRLYPTAEERQKQIDLLRLVPRAIRALDTSGISPVLQSTISPERMVQLKEIFDRIELPAFADIPDQETMAGRSSKRWRLPGTEIDFVLIQNGLRAGEYLVSADTIDRLPEFYQRVKDLPYKPGPAQRLNAIFRTLSSGRSGTIYDAFLSSPIGLATVVPLRWMLSLPRWSKTPIAGVTAWQWLGLLLGFLVGALFIFASHRLARRLADRSGSAPQPDWPALPLPLAVILVAAFLIPMLDALFRIGGTTRIVITFVQTTAFSLSAAWLSIIGLIILGDVIVASEHLKRSSLDSQLVRLGVRLIGALCAVLVLIQGADALGFPAYSVLAGLGVGGLAVALAARDSIANLLGSLLIMFEKPFRIGSNIKVSGTEGVVENVGFRSTRIRTLDNSVVSIPNNSIVNTTVENLSLRTMRRQQFSLQVTYDTSREKLEALVAGIRHLILDHPLTDKTKFYVRFNNFSESSLDILVAFHLEVNNRADELQEREVILLRIMNFMSEMGVQFAFPTRTLQINATLPAAGPGSAANARAPGIESATTTTQPGQANTPPAAPPRRQGGPGG